MVIIIIITPSSQKLKIACEFHYQFIPDGRTGSKYGVHKSFKNSSVSEFEGYPRGLPL